METAHRDAAPTQGTVMSRTFQDHDFLVWEVYPSGGAHGFSDNPDVIFHCLTQLDIRPRAIRVGINAADAQKQVSEMSDAQLVDLLERAEDIA